MTSLSRLGRLGRFQSPPFILDSIQYPVHPNFFPPTNLMLLQHRSGLLRLFRVRTGLSFSTLRAGSPVSISWNGSSWKARVKELDPKQSRVLVKYDEWSEQFDEWLSTADKDIQIDLLQSFPSPVESTNNAPSRTIIEVEVDGVTYRTSNLKDGRTVFLDNETGIVSWFPTSRISVSETIQVQENVDLPEGWIVRKDSSQSPYYFNTVNWKAQWIKPRLTAAEVAANMQRVAEVVPVGWEAYFDLDGFPYYYNTQTSETVWEFPVAESTPTESTSTPTKDSDISSVPDGWELYFTDDGVPYFYCKETSESFWELPEGVGSAAMDLPTCLGNPFMDSSSTKKPQKRSKKKLVN